MSAYNVTTRWDDQGLIFSEVELQQARQDQHQVVIQQVLNTQDQQIRKALIALGWTPPASGAV